MPLQHGRGKPQAGPLASLTTTTITTIISTSTLAVTTTAAATITTIITASHSLSVPTVVAGRC